jgi:hypothetical protein
MPSYYYVEIIAALCDDLNKFVSDPQPLALTGGFRDDGATQGC